MNANETLSAFIEGKAHCVWHLSIVGTFIALKASKDLSTVEFYIILRDTPPLRLFFAVTVIGMSVSPMSSC